MSSRRDYEAVASIIRGQYDAIARPDGERKVTACTLALEEVVTDLADHFAKHNPAFDKRKFHLAALGHIDAHLANIENEGSRT